MLALSLQCHNCIEDFQLCSICRDIPCCCPPENSEEGLKIVTCSISGWTFDSGTENSHSLQHGKRAAGASVSPWETRLTSTWHLNSLYVAVIRRERTTWQLSSKDSQLKLKMTATSSSNYTPVQGHSMSTCGRKAEYYLYFSAWSFSLCFWDLK